MKKSLFWMLSALAVSGLFTLAACDEDESEPVGVCDASVDPCANTEYPYCHVVNGSAVCSIIKECEAGSKMGSDGRCEGSGATLSKEGESCSNDDECEGSLVCVNNICAVAGQSYRYVRVDDRSDKCTVDAAKGNCGEDPGADIDAIALIKSDSTVSYAAEVVAYNRADSVQPVTADNEMAANPQRAIGNPDSFINYPTNKDDDVCYYWKQNTHPSTSNAERTYVSLGGDGGYIIVKMEKEIASGDKIDVLELGDCTLWNTTDKKDEKYQKAKGAEKVEVQISVSDKVDGEWVSLGTGSATKGIISFNTAGKI